MGQEFQEYIEIKGAYQNNLKHLELKLPLKKMIVITGVSGSGKSSLAFDTIYAEGQRRYVETFSSYARQFMDRMDKPKVERIDGIPPAIAIDQTNPVRTSRSTVGTMTELNDHLKLLFARASNLFCKKCGKQVRIESANSICEQIIESFTDQIVTIAFRIVIPRNFSSEEINGFLAAQGYSRILSKTNDEIVVIQDVIAVKKGNRDRLVEDIEVALKHGNGIVHIYSSVKSEKTEKLKSFSSKQHCADCDISYKEPVPGMFSFNSPVGACEKCKGFGRVIGVDYNLVVPDQNLSLAHGAIKPWHTNAYHECYDDLMRFASKRKIPTNIPWKDLTDAQRTWVLEGEGDFDDGVWYGVKRFFQWLETKSYKMHIRVLLSKYRAYHLCPVCKGARLKDESLQWYIGESDRKNLHDIMLQPIEECFSFFKRLSLQKDDEASQLVLDEICTRLKYLLDVGLGYLTLDRQSRTLSGGEVQRINLTTALGTSLVNTLFVLDEPSIGLHSRDINRLIGVLHNLRDAGNTIIVVEHDPEVIRAADLVVELGPGPGELGGWIVFQGSVRELLLSDKSKTAPYMIGNKMFPDASTTVMSRKKFITIKGAKEHNLKNIDISIPLNNLVCITGVSGSGKSTLVQDICFNGIKSLKGTPVEAPGLFNSITGHELIADVIFADQSPIGKTTRSNPVTYIGAFDAIRNKFIKTEIASKRGYSAKTFSFNTGTGRCPTCNGTGFEHVEMQFLSDVYIKCPDCDGKRFRKEILEVKVQCSPESQRLHIKEASISDVLEMTVDEAIDFFGNDHSITTSLEPLRRVGLAYMRLGQPLPTLSGGEAQRLKLAGFLSEIKNTSRKKNLFLFDEPTTGLHFEDIALLMNAFRSLVKEGHSVVIIEHNLDVISGADWIIDMGPDGGNNGGEIVFTGTPAEILMDVNSKTGAALKDYFEVQKNIPLEIRREIVHVSETAAYQSAITIRNAREHNLKNLDITIPRNKFTVITGVSGSGKSTIAFDILFSEGQRRYLESLNAYARQFIQPASKPDVDAVLGVPPTVAIEQRTSRGGRKSTVATVTEIYHYLRLLFVKLGVQYCPDCAIPIAPQSPESILAEIMKTYKNNTIKIYAPLVTNRKGIYVDLAQWAAQKGFSSLRVDGQTVEVSNWPKLDRFKEHSIELPVGEIRISAETEDNLHKLIDTALEYGKGTLILLPKQRGVSKERIFSILRACPQCQRSFDELDPRLFSYNSKHGWCPGCYGTGLHLAGFDENQTGEEIWWNEWFDGAERICPSCNGKRLKPEALSVRLYDKSIDEYSGQSVAEAHSFFRKIRLRGRDAAIAGDIIAELVSRLSFLEQVGLEYLTLDRAAPTLSGGEAQRIRLAAQLGTNLRGVCYILDEPTIGLHSRDNDRLLQTLCKLKEKGNTVVVVEHDEDTIRQAEYVLDLGPGGGKNGGKLLAQGGFKDILKCKDSVTGQYFRKPLDHSGKKRSITECSFLEIKKAHLHNLKNIDVKFPLERFVCVTGVSGSGKSTLVRDILYNNLKRVLTEKTSDSKFFGCRTINGWNRISRILEVDQSPIGKTPRSCPATYVGFMDDIRKLFARSPESMIRGYTASRFSFNTDEGRCPVCDGQGIKKIEMSFLPDVSVLCDTCGGNRFTPETLAIHFKDRSISEVLNMSIDEAVTFFAAHKSIHSALKLLQETGLGYLSLGQQSPTLSGGEAQRIKLVTELAKTATETTRKRIANSKVLYVLDEPTVGLHMADVEKLIGVLQRLVDAGNSVIVIEHNLDVIAEADWIIDMGPEGGDSGGEVVAEGTPGQILNKRSHTAKYLGKFIREKSGRMQG
ncbi:MAG: excinuclease ABC subunit UvrA [Fibrobacter sp.]|nr:excinuclease ABC subunit UvrA [Fibrobacter sp.]